MSFIEVTNISTGKYVALGVDCAYMVSGQSSELPQRSLKNAMSDLAAALKLTWMEGPRITGWYHNAQHHRDGVTGLKNLNLRISATRDGTEFGSELPHIGYRNNAEFLRIMVYGYIETQVNRFKEKVKNSRLDDNVISLSIYVPDAAYGYDLRFSVGFMPRDPGNDCRTDTDEHELLARIAPAMLSFPEEDEEDL